VSVNSMNFGQELKDIVLTKVAGHDVLKTLSSTGFDRSTGLGQKWGTTLLASSVPYDSLSWNFWPVRGL
jgi:hypothetical protein